jgi:hypothetical protein
MQQGLLLPGLGVACASCLPGNIQLQVRLINMHQAAALWSGQLHCISRLFDLLLLLENTLKQWVAVPTSKAASLLLAWATARVALRGHTGRRAAPRQRAAGRPRLRLLIAAGAFALASIMVVFSLQSAQRLEGAAAWSRSATGNLGGSAGLHRQRASSVETPPWMDLPSPPCTSRVQRVFPTARKECNLLAQWPHACSGSTTERCCA